MTAVDADFAARLRDEADLAIVKLDDCNDELVHLMCCKDDDMTVCGQRLDVDVCEDDDDCDGPSCVMCEHLWHADVCPRYGDCALAEPA